MYKFVGIDISKDKLDLGLLRDGGKVKTKSMSHDRKHFGQLEQWLLKNTGVPAAEVLICLEPTGTYHEALVYFLSDAGFNIFMANPGKARKYAESTGVTHKTDKKDALVLARYATAMQAENALELWQPEPTEARQLKVMLRRLDALERDLLREENRLEASQQTDMSERVLQSIRDMIRVLKEEIHKLQQDIDNHIDRFPDLKRNRELLESIKGVGQVVSREMVSLFACKPFKSAKQVGAFLGLIPKIKESGKWQGHCKLSKTGPSRLRAKLYMAAVVASTHNPDIRSQKQRLLQSGKNNMQALGAAMRKLVQICYGVIAHQKEYQPQVA